MRFGAPEHSTLTTDHHPTIDANRPPARLFDGTRIWSRNNDLDRGVDTCYTTDGTDRVLLRHLIGNSRPVATCPDTDADAIRTHLRRVAADNPHKLAGTLYAAAAWCFGRITPEGSPYQHLSFTAGHELATDHDRVDYAAFDTIRAILNRWTLRPDRYVDPLPAIAALLAEVAEATALPNWQIMSDPQLWDLPNSRDIANWLFTYIGE